MQHESKAESDKVTVKIKTTFTVEATITITEANKKPLANVAPNASGNASVRTTF